MSDGFGSDLGSVDSLESLDDRSSDSGDLLVEPEDDAGTAAPTSAVAAMAVDTRANAQKTCGLPSFEKLYGAPLDVLGASASTVAGFHPIFVFWDRFCKEKGQRISYIDPDKTDVKHLFALDLYKEDAFTGEEIHGDRYDKHLIITFFKWLQVESGTVDHFNKGKGFFNAHLRAEHYKRMAAAGHLNPHIGVAKVGTITEIKNLCRDVTKGKATNAMDTYRDLYERADDLLTDQDIRGNVSGHCIRVHILVLR
jgi:hypothetical protein